MTIGIIEDDRLLNQALAITMQNGGYDTICAYTMKEALTLLTGGEDLFLVDIVAHRYRTSGRGRHQSVPGAEKKREGPGGFPDSSG